MVGEIIVEGIVLVTLLIIAVAFGRNGVRLIDRQHFNREEFNIEPPRRNKECTEWSRELNKKFAQHNRTNAVETETIIRLPGKTAATIVAMIESLIAIAMVVMYHFDGIAEFLITGEVYDVDALLSGQIATLILMLLAYGIFAGVLYEVIKNAAKARALYIGKNRAKKNRKVYFVQALGVGEIWRGLVWAISEEFAEHRNKRIAKKRSKQATRKPKTKNNVIKLHTAS